MAKRITPQMEKINRRNERRKRKKYSFWGDVWHSLCRNPVTCCALVVTIGLILIAIFADVIAPYPYDAADYLNMLSPPSAEHWFGTDNLGRDLFSRCIYGARYSLSLGLLCMLLGMVSGGLLGLIASFFGGAVDNVIMRIMDVFQAIPGTLMAITVIAALGKGIPQLLFALALSSLPIFSKTVRAAIFTVRENEYIESSRALGAGNLRLMFRHMLPNALGHIIIYAVGMISGSIMLIATLSYIGLGIQPPTPEWGALLNAGKGYITSSAYLVFYPGLCIMVAVLALNILGNGLRDALDPRLK